MPDDLKQRVASLLEDLFASADQRGQAAAASFAACFTKNAYLMAGSRPALTGRDDIEASREKSWDGITSRTHTMNDLFVSIDHSQRFVALGVLELLLDTSKHALKLRFCAKLDVEQDSEGIVKIARYEAFTEPPPPVK